MDKNTARELYKLYRTELLEYFKLHRQAFHHYLTLSVAILGATLAGYVQLQDPWSKFLLIVGPIANIIVCDLAITMCNRAYKGALDRVPLILKLEEKLKLIKMEDVMEKGDWESFREDDYFIPSDWAENALDYTKSGDFVKDNKQGGVNKQVRRTFELIGLVSALLLVAILVKAIIDLV